MASPEEIILEQRTRALNLREDSLNRQAEQQSLTEKRLNTHQKEVAEKERSNRLKAQELTLREQKLQEDQQLLEQESLSLANRQVELASRQKKSQLFFLPVLLCVCIAGGYLAYDYVNQQKLHYALISQASKNIDKLANLLNITQDQVIDKSNDLLSKKLELDKTKQMLLELKITSDRLYEEINKFESSPLTASGEKTTLSLSAETLAAQLASLRTQLEDNYLTIDINEAYIDHQENDLNLFKAALADHQKKLAQKEGSIQEQQVKQALLEELLQSSKTQNQQLSKQLDALNNSLKELQRELKETLKENRSLIKENTALQTQIKS